MFEGLAGLDFGFSGDSSSSFSESDEAFDAPDGAYDDEESDSVSDLSSLAAAAASTCISELPRDVGSSSLPESPEFLVFSSHFLELSSDLLKLSLGCFDLSSDLTFSQVPAVTSSVGQSTATLT